MTSKSVPWLPMLGVIESARGGPTGQQGIAATMRFGRRNCADLINFRQAIISGSLQYRTELRPRLRQKLSKQPWRQPNRVVVKRRRYVCRYSCSRAEAACYKGSGFAASSRIFLKRGSVRNGSQIGSRATSRALTPLAVERRCSSNGSAASASSTMA